MTDDLAIQAQMNVATGDTVVSLPWNTEIKKTTAYGVHVKTKPKTVMTIPSETISNMFLLALLPETLTFQNSSLHLNTSLTKICFDTFDDLFSHAF